MKRFGNMKQHFSTHWKHYLLVFLILGGVTVGSKTGFVPSPIATPSPVSTPLASPLSSSVSPANCDPSLWLHIYHGPKFQGGIGTGNDRLSVLNPCVTVTGTVDFVRTEKDGDFHMGLKLDSQFANMVNDCNSTCLNGSEHGDLVIEPVCMNPVSQTDTNDEGVCNGFSQNLSIPNVGQHVSITGAYVKDNDHGWNEIHPVTSINVVP